MRLNHLNRCELLCATEENLDSGAYYVLPKNTKQDQRKIRKEIEDKNQTNKNENNDGKREEEGEEEVEEQGEGEGESSSEVQDAQRVTIAATVSTEALRRIEPSSEVKNEKGVRRLWDLSVQMCKL